MVQTAYLGSNPDPRTISTKQPVLEKLDFQKCIPSNICVDNRKLKNKNCTKLKPLNVKTENVQNSTKGKLPCRLNPFLVKSVENSNQKKLASKIPVLQKKALHIPKQNFDFPCDTALSAADRRQKFHESRLRAPAVVEYSVSSVLNNNTYQYKDLVPWRPCHAMPKVTAVIYGVNQKNILPPIKVPDMMPAVAQKANHSKNKCLLGEITHFPALCNPVHSKRPKNHVSTISGLPPILPPPAAPPPSICTSLEQDGSQKKEQKYNRWEEWNPSKSTVFYKSIAA